MLWRHLQCTARQIPFPHILGTCFPTDYFLNYIECRWEFNIYVYSNFLMNYWFLGGRVCLVRGIGTQHNVGHCMYLTCKFRHYMYDDYFQCDLKLFLFPFCFITHYDFKRYIRSYKHPASDLFTYWRKIACLPTKLIIHDIEYVLYIGPSDGVISCLHFCWLYWYNPT